MCMEGIEQNPVVYELMSEMAFRSERVQLEVNRLLSNHIRETKVVSQMFCAYGRNEPVE